MDKEKKCRVVVIGGSAESTALICRVLNNHHFEIVPQAVEPGRDADVALPVPDDVSSGKVVPQTVLENLERQNFMASERFAITAREPILLDLDMIIKRSVSHEKPHRVERKYGSRHLERLYQATMTSRKAVQRKR